MTVKPQQRFTRNRPCPVCNGRDGDQRGQSKRCFGFLSDDGGYAHCTRPEYAGQLEINSKSATFPHRLAGDCGCGNTHGLEAPTAPGHNDQQARPIVDTYDYTDEDGNFLFQVVRYDPKDFKQRRRDGKGGWIWDLEGVRRVLYRLPELMAADPAKPVFIVEGEKDADRLIQQGLIATTNPMGAGKWLPEYSGFLEGRLVVIIPDNDKEGTGHAPKVAYSVHSGAKSVGLLELSGLPEDGGDVSDWLNAGGTAQELMDLARKVPEWKPSESSPADEVKQNKGFQFTSLIDLLAEPPEAIDYAWDKTLPAGGISIMAAKPKVGKSTTARCLALAVAKGEGFLGRSTNQGPVVYLALEEKRSEVQAHFAGMGALDEEIYLHFGSSPEDALPKLETSIAQYQPALVIIDPLMRFIRVRDSNDYAEMTRVMEPLMTMARVSGAHILCVHHAGKGDREGGDIILGSTALFGSVDTALIMRKKGAGRTIESIQRYGENLPETVMGLDVETGSVSDAGTLADTETRAAAARIIRAVGDGAMTQNELRESVEGATKYTIAALHQLHKNGDLHRDGTGKKGDPFTYSNVKLPGVGEEDEKGGFPVPAIYGELENWKNQNNVMPEAGDAREQQTASDSGFPEPETVTIEQPELDAVEEGEI